MLLRRAIALLLLLLISSCSGEDVVLKCDEYNDKIGGMEKFCTVSGFQITHSQNIKITPYFRANQTNFMKFYNSVLLDIPAKLFDVFSSLKTLDVSHTEIEDISRNTFTSASMLTTLNLSHNLIEKINTSAFVGAHNLMRLDLSHNRIHTLGSLAFRGLTNMNKVILSYNALTSIPTDLFLDNAYMDAVYLDYNQLEELKAEVFHGLRHIRELNVAHNRLKQFDPQTFQNSYGPEMLILAHNQLKDFHLQNKTITKRLDLDSNRLSKLIVNGTSFITANNNSITHVEVWNGQDVNTLLLKQNNLSDINSIVSLAQLTELDLSYNPVGNPNISTFQNLKHLTILNLRATGISKLAFGMFSKLENLDVLDLAYNNLTELNLDMFVPANTNVRTFYVDANNLTEIKGKYSFAKAFPSLVELGISRNRFNCSYLHWLLIKPQLGDFTKLHIEHDDNPQEQTHIRDVTCLSNKDEELHKAEHELADSKHFQTVMKQSLDTMSEHAKQMQTYLLVLSLILSCLVVLVATVCIFGGIHYWRVQRAKFFQRRGGVIVFNSNATVNTHVEQ
ncbi:insulin-like growth factor-binding protein complex acid labile subunit [Musca vetustissima]|uniref:insulin-like growth factor-binding protein complex acid labile subunit n=1 Tax=Musca vetustissima TaxID=27455 RepID=UPI002AB695B3|nr:insulin-like growth factor-binding protein complex acid labile subunit [Musca vetustissima]